MPVQVRFVLRAEPSPTNSATTVTNVIAIQPLFSDNDEVYAFPDELKAVSHHDQLFKITNANTAKQNLKPRWARRTFKISLPDDVARLYFDSDDNPVFMGQMLNIFNESLLLQPPASSASTSDTSSNSAPATQPTQRSLASIVKEAALPKFNGKSTNAGAWLETFVSECQRLEIPQERYWQALRLFLEEAAEKWFNNTRLSSTSTAWEFWHDLFLETFTQKGLAAAKSAFAFKYISGSLTDYAHSKMTHLMNFNPKMDELTKIAHIATGLPQNYQDRIDLNECDTIGKLFAKINTFDKPRAIISSPNPRSNAFSSLQSREKPICGYCKKKGFDRRHYEKECFTKLIDNQRKNSKSSDFPKAIHNVNVEELERELNECQKNE